MWRMSWNLIRRSFACFKARKNTSRTRFGSRGARPPVHIVDMSTCYAPLLITRLFRSATHLGTPEHPYRVRTSN